MDNQEAGMPLLTENLHSESLLAGSCLELRELWRLVRVFGQPIKHIQSIGWTTTWAEKGDCTRYVLYVPPPTVPYLILLSEQLFQVGVIILILQMKIGITQHVKIHPKSHSQQMAEISQLTSKPVPSHFTCLFLLSAFSVGGTLPSASHASFHLHPR